jgi:hypothetical protein
MKVVTDQKNISGLSDIEYSFDLKTPNFLCPKQTKKMQPKSKESQQDLLARNWYDMVSKS